MVLMGLPDIAFIGTQEGEEGEEDDSEDSGDREGITDVSELARMASRGEPNIRRISPVAAVCRDLILLLHVPYASCRRRILFVTA